MTDLDKCNTESNDENGCRSRLRLNNRMISITLGKHSVRRCNNRVRAYGTPTLLGYTDGRAFYECPKYGDEGFLLVNLGGDWFETEFVEIPDSDEFTGTFDI